MLECAEFSLLDEVALATAEAVRGATAATADAVRPLGGVAASLSGAVFFAAGAGSGAGAAFAGTVFFAAALVGAEADFFAATGEALAGAAFAAGLAGALVGAFSGAAGVFATAFAATFATDAGVAGVALEAVFAVGFAAAPTEVFTDAFSPATTSWAVFTSPTPPFLAAPLAAAELLASFAISFTSVAVAAGCYSPDALAQQPIFWDTVDWLYAGRHRT